MSDSINEIMAREIEASASLDQMILETKESMLNVLGALTEARKSLLNIKDEENETGLPHEH